MKKIKKMTENEEDKRNDELKEAEEDKEMDPTNLTTKLLL